MKTDSQTCADGLVCPHDAICRSVGGFDVCATQDDIDACSALEDTDPCDPANERKLCREGVCIDTCGNARMETYENCDDGNVTAGDGCSRVCHVETCGNGDIDLAIGEECDDGTGALSGDGCSSTCKREQPVWTPIDTSPIAGRAEHAMASWVVGSVHQVVLFGGITADGIAGDTWVYDASGTWSRKDPARSPSPRFGHSMAFDSDRHKVVLFGGYSSAGFLDDTWEWDGEIWTEVTPATNNPFRRMHAGMAYDSARQVMVMVSGETTGGGLFDTQEWNGTQWMAYPTLTPPSGTENAVWHQLAFDAFNGELIWCIKGIGTYRFEGSAWVQRSATCPSNGGASSSASRMAYDPRQQKLVMVVSNGTVFTWNHGTSTWDTTTNDVGGGFLRALADDGDELVLFGGHLTGALSDPDPANYMRETWRWRSPAQSQFQQSFSSDTRVPHMFRAAAVYSTKRAKAILYGGYLDGAVQIATWEFDREGWHLVEPELPPVGGVRHAHAMAYDSDRDEVVMFGGRPDTAGVPFTFLQDTRIYDKDGAWLAPILSTEPSARRSPAMAYDAKRKQIVLFGGDGDTNDAGNYLADTWIWDGATKTWSQRMPVTSPPRRSQAVMAYDPERERIVMYGGRAGTVTYYRDTWEWDGTNWTVIDDGGLPVTRPEHRGEGTLVWNPLRHRIVLFGGDAIEYDGAHYGDVWEWDGATWTLVLDDIRLARGGQIAFFDPIRGGIVTYGGEISTFTGISDETWILRYESQATREACRLPDVDEDGDMLVGCADPDCAARCSFCANGACDPEDHLFCPADCP